jgi:hypothetical protein
MFFVMTYVLSENMIFLLIAFGQYKQSVTPILKCCFNMVPLKIVLFSLALIGSAKSEISQEGQEIARKWMPVLWLHSEEVFMPINFIDYIAQMELRDADQNVVQDNPTAETLLTGPESVDLHLNTRTDIDCVHCYDDVFFGQPIDQVIILI